MSNITVEFTKVSVKMDACNKGVQNVGERERAKLERCHLVTPLMFICQLVQY